MAISPYPEVAPAVISKFIDLSTYVRTVPSTVGFIPIISAKGRDNELIRVNGKSFFEEFGEPNILYGAKEYGQGMYVAESFLKGSDSLYVIRCMPPDATYANVGITTSRYYTYGESGSPTIDTISFGDLTSERIVDAKFKSISGGVDSEGNIIAVGADIDAAYAVAQSESFLAANDSTGLLLDEDTFPPDLAVLILGRGRGESYNDFKISIVIHPNPVLAARAIYRLNIYKKMEDLDLVIADAGVDETYTFENRYEIIYSYNVSFDPDFRGVDGEKMFIQDVINNNNPELMCVADITTCREAVANEADWDSSFSSEVAMWGGSSGSLLDTTTDADNVFDDDDVETVSSDIGTELLVRAYGGTLEKAWNLTDDTTKLYVNEVLNTEIYISIVLDGGYPTAVKDEAVRLSSEYRKDCITFLDNGDNYSVAQAITSRMEDHNYNTFHAAVYECYTQLHDPFTAAKIWLTPIYHVARLIPATERVSEIWTTAAGFDYATLNGVKAMRFSPTVGEQDAFYVRQINPIIKFNIGDTVFGQLTTLKKPSALQDINIVRMLLYIKRALENFTRFYIYKENNDRTWRRIRTEITAFLEDIKTRRGLYWYEVEVGATEYEIDAKEIRVDITLKPTRVVERIKLNFYIE